MIQKEQQNYQNEVWIDLPQYEGFYEISNTCRVRSAKTKVEKIYQMKDGYKRVELYKDNKKKVRYLHRLFAQTFIPNPDNLPEVNHIDGNKLNNNIDNLQWCTKQQNVRHAFQVLNRRHHNLNYVQARLIRRLREFGWSVNYLMEFFNVPSSSTIYGILNYKTWKSF